MILDKDKKIEIQQKEIEKLIAENKRLNDQINLLKAELNEEKNKSDVAYEKAKRLIETLDSTKKEYESLIKGLRDCKVKYEEQVKQVRELKNKYSKELKKTHKGNRNIFKNKKL